MNTDTSISVFGYENKFTKEQVVTTWLDGEIPSDSNAKTFIDFTFYGGKFSFPVYVDLREGKVFQIPKCSKKGTVYQFNDIPYFDCG